MYAVDYLNMTVPVGAIYGFIGENGSGKSTTEKLICGHLVPNEGEINMILAFFIGSLLGGAISGLPIEMAGFGTSGLVMCILSKIILSAVFVPIYLIVSVAAKQKLWLSLILSFIDNINVQTSVKIILTAPALFICERGDAHSVVAEDLNFTV